MIRIILFWIFGIVVPVFVNIIFIIIVYFWIKEQFRKREENDS